jgi:hypothetical protein
MSQQVYGQEVMLRARFLGRLNGFPKEVTKLNLTPDLGVSQRQNGM